VTGWLGRSCFDSPVMYSSAAAESPVSKTPFRLRAISLGFADRETPLSANRMPCSLSPRESETNPAPRAYCVTMIVAQRSSQLRAKTTVSVFTWK
jgi:hypothetical protein